MEITCYRDAELAREQRKLPAAVYNRTHALLSRSPSGCLFVPIRSMQYLAIVDREEIVFLDGNRKCWIDLAWRDFKPQQRSALDEPVAYQAVYYCSEAQALMPRLQAEFPRALEQLAARERFDGEARVFKFPAPPRG